MEKSVGEQFRDSWPGGSLHSTEVLCYANAPLLLMATSVAGGPDSHMIVGTWGICMGVELEGLDLERGGLLAGNRRFINMRAISHDLGFNAWQGLPEPVLTCSSKKSEGTAPRRCQSGHRKASRGVGALEWIYYMKPGNPNVSALGVPRGHSPLN